MSNEIKHYVGTLSAPAGTRVTLIYSRFNSFIVDRLVNGAVDCLTQHGVEPENIVKIEVPGAWELPWAAARSAKQDNPDAIVTLGAVIRGGTPHFEYVAGEASAGLRQVMLESDVPIGFGLLTTDNVEQAEERSGETGNNKGWDAALTVIEMVSLSKILKADGR